MKIIGILVHLGRRVEEKPKCSVSIKYFLVEGTELSNQCLLSSPLSSPFFTAAFRVEI